MTINFLEEVRENATIRVQLSVLFVDALEDDLIRNDVIKEAPMRLYVAIDLAKNSENLWEEDEE